MRKRREGPLKEWSLFLKHSTSTCHVQLASPASCTLDSAPWSKASPRGALHGLLCQLMSVSFKSSGTVQVSSALRMRVTSELWMGHHQDLVSSCIGCTAGGSWFLPICRVAAFAAGLHSLLTIPQAQHGTQGVALSLRPPRHLSTPAHPPVSKDEGSLTIWALIWRTELHNCMSDWDCFKLSLVPAHIHQNVPYSNMWPHWSETHILFHWWHFGFENHTRRGQRPASKPGRVSATGLGPVQTFNPGAWNILQTHQTSFQLSPEELWTFSKLLGTLLSSHLSCSAESQAKRKSLLLES